MEKQSGTSKPADQFEVVPGLRTLLGWAKRHPAAPLMGMCAAAAVIVLVAQQASNSTALIGILLAIPGMTSFVWAMWLLQNYRTAPRPAKLLAWCICLSGGLVFLAAAVRLVMLLFSVQCPLFLCERPREPDCPDESWVARDDYNSHIFEENTKKGLYPAKLYGREKRRDVYEICAIWAPAPAPFASYNWLTPTQFAQRQAQFPGWRPVSLHVVSLQNGGYAIQVTWIKPS